MKLAKVRQQVVLPFPREVQRLPLLLLPLLASLNGVVAKTRQCQDRKETLNTIPYTLTPQRP